MSFSNLVLLLILKKTSLLLSVTLIFKCSAPAGASLRSPVGLPLSFSPDILEVGFWGLPVTDPPLALALFAARCEESM